MAPTSMVIRCSTEVPTPKLVPALILVPARDPHYSRLTLSHPLHRKPVNARYRDRPPDNPLLCHPSPFKKRVSKAEGVLQGQNPLRPLQTREGQQMSPSIWWTVMMNLPHKAVPLCFKARTEHRQPRTGNIRTDEQGAIGKLHGPISPNLPSLGHTNGSKRTRSHLKVPYLSPPHDSPPSVTRHSQAKPNQTKTDFMPFNPPSSNTP